MSRQHGCPGRRGPRRRCAPPCCGRCRDGVVRIGDCGGVSGPTGGDRCGDRSRSRVDGDAHAGRARCGAAVRASLALAGCFARWAAFDLAIDAAARAFDGAGNLDGIPIDGVAYSYGYVSVEGAHVAVERSVRVERLAHAQRGVAWLAHHGSTDIARQMLAPGLDGEIALASGENTPVDAIEASTRLYPQATPDLVAWHLLVRACLALRSGLVETAVDLLDRSIPGLQASADNHCLVRALEARSRARAQTGDLDGALADANHLATSARRWQIDQVGRLAEQVARRAELESTSTLLRKRADRLAEDLDTDLLTGVHSRRWLEHQLSRWEHTDGDGSVIMLDIDRFKQVNDTHGHHVGDEVLHDVATLIGRVDDGRHPVARYGGEEFAVLVDEDADGHVGAKLAEQIRETVAAHDWGDLTPGLSLTVSCGVATGPLTTIRSLLIAADIAMLASKRAGRNRATAATRAAPQPSLFG